MTRDSKGRFTSRPRMPMDEKIFIVLFFLLMGYILFMAWSRFGSEHEARLTPEYPNGRLSLVNIPKIPINQRWPRKMATNQ